METSPREAVRSLPRNLPDRPPRAPHSLQPLSPWPSHSTSPALGPLPSPPSAVVPRRLGEGVEGHRPHLSVLRALSSPYCSRKHTSGSWRDPRLPGRSGGSGPSSQTQPQAGTPLWVLSRTFAACVRGACAPRQGRRTRSLPSPRSLQAPPKLRPGGPNITHSHGPPLLQVACPTMLGPVPFPVCPTPPPSHAP